MRKKTVSSVLLTLLLLGTLVDLLLVPTLVDLLLGPECSAGGIAKSESTQAWDVSAQIMPQKDDQSVANAWFSAIPSKGSMFMRLYNASSSQGDNYGRIWLEPRPFGSVNNVWYDLYQSQEKNYGTGYQNTFSNSTHAWVYCHYLDSRYQLRFKYNITFSWEYPFAKVTPAIFKDDDIANISSMIRFDLTRFTFTKAMVPNISEPYSYSSPTEDQNVTLIDDSNRASWNDNYIALYDSNHNRSLIFSWQYKAHKIKVTEDQSEEKFGYVYVYFGDKTYNWVDGYVSHNSTFVSWTRTLDSSQTVSNLKAVFSRYAHISLAHPTAITVQRTTISDSRFNIKTSVTYTDLPNEWHITPTHYTPCLVHTATSTYGWKERSAFGTIYYVQSDTATGYLDLHQGFYPSWLKYAYANWNWLKANRWLDLSVGGAWSKDKTSDIYIYDHVQVLLTTCWLYQITNNATLLDFVKDGADWTVSVMHSDGNVTMYFDQQGNEKGSYIFTTVHHALAYAYDVTGNNTYLTYAERNANYETQNNLWMHNVTDPYHTDNELIGFTKLYLLTSNSTYKTWGQDALRDCVDLQDIYLFGWYSSDISASSHVARGIVYYLDKVGNDISGYDLEASAKKYLDATWVQRDDWSGQLMGIIAYLREYIKYPCHNEFPSTAFERYCIYLIGEKKKVPRIYLDLIYENIDWIFGDNELSQTFENTGAIRRCIQLDASCTPFMLKQYQTYDQANFMWALLWMHELYQELAKTHGICLYSPTVRVDTRQSSIDYTITNPFILSTTANLTSLTYSSPRLTFTLSDSSGSSSTRVYCGPRGEPTASCTVNGTMTWSYNCSTTLLTLNISHEGPTRVLIYWKLPGDVNNDGIADVFDFALIGRAYGSTPGCSNWNEGCDINGDKVIDINDLAVCDYNYGARINEAVSNSDVSSSAFY